MTRSNHLVICSVLRVPLTAVLFTLLASTISYAQRGATMGHPGAGPHFVAPMHMAGAPPAMRRSPHLTSLARARSFPAGRGWRPMPRGSSRSIFTPGNRVGLNHWNRVGFNHFFPRDNLRFAIGIPNQGFFPWTFGLWPWWGWWGWGWSWGWDWDWDHGRDSHCHSYDQNGDCSSQRETGGEVDSRDATDRPMIVVYLRDGSGYSALDYWVTHGTLHIVTTYGEQKTFLMEEVDLERTGKENAENGIHFSFRTSPMISDPGPVLAPDSYAPACPPGSSARQSTDPRSTTIGGTAKSEWFGISGNPSEKGVKVSSVRVGSPAAEMGLQAGDVLVRVDCRPVRNPQDLESALADSTSTVWVSYLIQGSWLTDKKVFR